MSDDAAEKDATCPCGRGSGHTRIKAAGCVPDASPTPALTAEQREALAAALREWWASDLTDSDDAAFIRTAPESVESSLAYTDALAPLIARLVADAEQRGRAEVSAAVEAVADEIESERTNFDFIRREHAQVAAQLRATLTDPAAAVARIKAEALREAADEMDEFAAETYPEDIFRRPTAEQYAEINALLKRERGHQLDGIAADVMTRAIKVQAARLREKADEIGGTP